MGLFVASRWFFVHELRSCYNFIADDLEGRLMIPFEAIIKGETNDSRFEKFCRALLQKSEGVTLVSTSESYDLGRDGVSVRRTKGTHAEVLCCTIDKDIESKVIRDATRLASTTVPEHVFYCCSLPLTEHKINELSADFRAQLPKPAGITFLGARQLCDIAERFPDLFREFYHSEVRSAEATLQAFQSGQTTSETRGLRLALLSFGSDEAQELRRQITTRAVLDVMAACETCTSAAIAQKLSSDLGLPSVVSDGYIKFTLQRTTLQGLTENIAGETWRLTEHGRAEAKSVPPEAAQEVLAGRTIVRDALQRLIGKKIADSQYDLIWSSLLDFFSEYFYTSGLAIISAVNTFLGDKPQSQKTGASLDKVIDEGAKKVRAQIKTPELADQIEQAIRDVFTERTGEVFEWLSRLCERFVILCALGLEGTSSDEVRSVLVRHRLVLDTDIILTSLCESEPDHQAARELISRFRQIGGKVVLSSQVLEEVAYHAWIADRESRDSIPLFGKLGPDDLRKYLRNTFVRAFFLLGWKHEAKLEQWDLYINQYRGHEPHDHSKLLKVLQTNLLAERLPDLVDESLRKDVTQFMKESAAHSRNLGVGQLGQDELGKAETDGKVLGSICAARENLRQQGSEDTVVLLSSSNRLRRADHEFRARLAAPNAVISPAAFSYLLSLVPGINLGLSTLRRALFDFRDSGRLADTQRLALKGLKSSGLYEIPWATRGTLEEHLNSKLRQEADKLGQKVDVVRRKFATGDSSINSAQLILDAVKDMAVNDKREKELAEAQRRIAELEDQVKDFTRLAAGQKTVKT